MKGFKKGQSGNPAGRPKGTPNKTTEEIRTILQDFLSKNLDGIQESYESLDAKEKLTFIDRLLKHILPAPLHPLEKLTPEQLDEIINKLKNGEL